MLAKSLIIMVAVLVSPARSACNVGPTGWESVHFDAWKQRVGKIYGGENIANFIAGELKANFREYEFDFSKFRKYGEGGTKKVMGDEKWAMKISIGNHDAQSHANEISKIQWHCSRVEIRGQDKLTAAQKKCKDLGNDDCLCDTCKRTLGSVAQAEKWIMTEYRKENGVKQKVTMELQRCCEPMSKVIIYKGQIPGDLVYTHIEKCGIEHMQDKINSGNFGLYPITDEDKELMKKNKNAFVTWTDFIEETKCKINESKALNYKKRFSEGNGYKILVNDCGMVRWFDKYGYKIAYKGTLYDPTDEILENKKIEYSDAYDTDTCTDDDSEEDDTGSESEEEPAWVPPQRIKRPTKRKPTSPTEPVFDLSKITFDDKTWESIQTEEQKQQAIDYLKQDMPMDMKHFMIMDKMKKLEIKCLKSTL